MVSEQDFEFARKSLPVVTGKVNAIVAKRNEWSQADLQQRFVQFGSVNFSYKDIISFSEIFTLVDTDGSGQISPSEAKHLLNLIGEQVQLSEVENLIAEFDLDGNGEVSLTEFVFVLALQRKSEFSKKDIMNAFDLFARGSQARQGVIDKDILQQNLIQYGLSAASEREIQKLIASLPCADNSVNEFDYVKHIATFLS
eukprot:jgi/Ulvmu1/8053/UM004_0290.1